jgi:hypothetical protein
MMMNLMPLVQLPVQLQPVPPTPAMAALLPAAAADDTPSPPAPPVDPCDFTKWDVLDLHSIPLPAQNYLADDFRALCSAYAGLLLCFMPLDVEASFPDQVQALYAGYQEFYQRPESVEHVRRYPSVGRDAYIADEVRWFKETYEFLKGRFDNAERAKRLLPAKKRPKRATSTAFAAPAAPSPAAAGGSRTTPRTVRADDTEDEDEPSLGTQSTRKRGCKARWTNLCTKSALGSILFIFDI